MGITFEGPAILVADIAISRAFYETTLAQAVLADHGPHVAFTGGFSIWQAEHATQTFFGMPKARTVPLGTDNLELYFETPDLDGAWAKVSAALPKFVEIVHPIRVQPWGQRCFRLHDPDGHLVELAEPLPMLVKRLQDNGMTPEEIAAATSIPLEGVKAMAKG